MQTNGDLVLPLDATALVADSVNGVCAISHGALQCDAPPFDGGVVQLLPDVLAVSMRDPYQAVCALLGDGGLWCDGQPLATSQPATALSFARPNLGCAILAGTGELQCWGSLAYVGFSAGATAVAVTEVSGRASACVGYDAGLMWGDVELGTFSVPTSAPVTGIVMGLVHNCALLGDGTVWCWGSNGDGQLGDRSVQPLGPQQRSELATFLNASARTLVFESQGSMFAIDNGVAIQDDAGIIWETSRPVPLPGPRAGYLTECRCHLEGSVAVCNDVQLPGGLPSACGSPSRDGFACFADGEVVHCYGLGGEDLPTHELSSFDAGGDVVLLREGFSGTICALRSDGIVRCSMPSPVESLAPVADLCLGTASGCALLDGGTMECWGTVVDAGTPVVPAGAWPVVRQITCGARHACALAGSNIVQCWGDNDLGQLGLDGPGSTRAVPVPMPEPVRSIAAGGDYTCALLQSGHLSCWGDNRMGQLGPPALNTSMFPIQVVH
jgi:hypothetical protein